MNAAKTTMPIPVQGADSTVRDRVSDVVSATLGVPRQSVETATSLLDLPGFDSLAIASVLERLEDGLGTEVPAHLIVPEAFLSLHTLTELLMQSLPGETGQAAQTVPTGDRS